jgi:hypothetical protein
LPKVDATDTGIINASPMAVYNAVMDEYSGVTRLWTSFLECRPRGDKPMDTEGAVCDLTIHKYGMAARFSDKFIKTTQGKSIDLELSGDLIGNETWIFEPFEDKTKVTIHWKGATNRLLFSLFPSGQAAKIHSGTVQQVFAALNSSLSKK